MKLNQFEYWLKSNINKSRMVSNIANFGTHH